MLNEILKKINKEKLFIKKGITIFKNNNMLKQSQLFIYHGGSAGYYKLKTLELNVNCLKYLSEYMKEVERFFKVLK